MIILSLQIYNWFKKFRKERPKDIGFSLHKDKIYADYIIEDFVSLLTFNINHFDINIVNILKTFIITIFRETSYCKENNFINNQCMRKSGLHGLLAEIFFTECITCKKPLIDVDYQCIDKICKNCKLHYEIKSLSWTDYPPHINSYKFGEISGVKNFLKKNNNILILHCISGYFYTTVKKIINHKKTTFNIIRKNKAILTNISLNQLLNYSKEKIENDRLKVNIQLEGSLFTKIKNKKDLYDIKMSLLKIFSYVDDFFKLPWNIDDNFYSIKNVKDTILHFKI